MIWVWLRSPAPTRRHDTLCVDRRIGGYPIQVLSIEVGARREQEVTEILLRETRIIEQAIRAGVQRCESSREAVNELT
ncbi:hypothetical protein [Bradyrhizobium sp. CCBAU 51627]|uniref:hypothetical protein n=1 Tax=Bradyrhizobium sp. CCBAU 51627 TaxID=1325088 RepID=UPI0023063D9E|nr:hypothetical protein [Bradyrhizobium sp. CCBAU 51627]MDA9436903.1 hypothetical protein [Bradyrhizobium sp. CCBAU 51627]